MTIPRKEQSNPTSRLKTIICLFLAIAVLIPYWQAGEFDFVHMDDEDYVTQNPTIRAGVTLDGTIRVFTEFDSANWHPLTWLSHMLDVELYGLHPKGHHWTSVQLHILNTLLLFLLLQQMTGALWRSAMVAALFGLHPLHVESVAWVAERKDVLSTFLGLLTLMAYTRYAKQPRLSMYLLLIFLFVLGLMAKPMLVTLPFLMLLLDMWPLGRIRPSPVSGSSDEFSILWMQRLLPLLTEKIPLFILAAGSSVVTFLAQKAGGAVGSLEIITPGIRVVNALSTYLSYLEKALWPYPLVVFYPHPGSSVSIAHAVGAACVIFPIIVIAVCLRRRVPYMCVGWFWYLGTLVPVIGLVQVGSQSMADRYTYIPLIGIFIIATWGAHDILKKSRFRKPILVSVAGVLLPILAFSTYHQVAHWKNSVTLFRHATETTANNWLAYNNLGTALDLDGKLNEAIVSFEKALSISPGYVDALFNLGMGLYKQGDRETAADYYRKALKRNPNHLGSHLNLGSLMAEEDRVSEAISHYNEVLRIDPGNADTHNNLSVLYENQNDRDAAIDHLKKSLELNPDSVDANYNYGSLLRKSGETEEAMAYIAKALSILHHRPGHTIKPMYARVYFDMGVGLTERGQTEAAILFFKKAIEINPDYQDARNNLRLLSEMLSE